MSHKQTFVVTVTSDKPVSNLAAKIGNRLWTIDSVSEVKTWHADVMGSTAADPDGLLVATNGEPV